MLRLERPLVVLDVETTGVSVEEDRIVEIAAIKIFPDGSEVERCRRINPGRPIPPEVTEIHGISDADVAGCPTFAQAARSVFEFFDGADVGGYNVRRYDVPLLSAEFRRVGRRWPAEGTVVVDAFKVFRIQEELHTLAKAHEHYGLGVLTETHRALVDVGASLRILRAQAERYEAATVEAIEKLAREPDWADSEGKIRNVNGALVMNINPHMGKPLSQVEASFLAWILKKDFPADTKALVRRELELREEVGPRECFDRVLDDVIAMGGRNYSEMHETGDYPRGDED